jgi:hypothetical protein
VEGTLNNETPSKIREMITLLFGVGMISSWFSHDFIAATEGGGAETFPPSI